MLFLKLLSLNSESDSSSTLNLLGIIFCMEWSILWILLEIDLNFGLLSVTPTQILFNLEDNAAKLDDVAQL